MALGHGQQAQVLHQPLEQVGFLQRRADVTLVCRVDPIQDPFQAAAQHREGCAQFVGDIGQHVPPLTVVALQGIRHLVKTVAQVAQVVRPLHPGPRLQMPAGDLLRRGDHFGQGGHHPPRQQQADQGGEDRQDQGSQQHRLEEAEREKPL